MGQMDHRRLVLPRPSAMDRSSRSSARLCAAMPRSCRKTLQPERPYGTASSTALGQVNPLRKKVLEARDIDSVRQRRRMNTAAGTNYQVEAGLFKQRHVLVAEDAKTVPAKHFESLGVADGAGVGALQYGAEI